MNDIYEIVTFMANAIWHVWPFFVISIFLAVLINQLNLSGAIRRAFDNKIGIAIAAATVVGAFSPFCSCTVIPVIAGLLASGVPLAPIMSFWVASPTMDPEIFALTAGVLGMPLAIVRLGATLLLSLAAGFLTWGLMKTPFLAGRTVLKETATPKSSCSTSSCEAASRETVALEPAACGTTACATTITPEPELAFAGDVMRLDMAVPAAACCGGDNAVPEPELAFSGDVMQLNMAMPAAAVCCGGSSTLPAPAPAKKAGWQDQLWQSVQQIDWHDFGAEMARQSWNIGRWILLAFFLEALITLYVPQATIASLLGEQSTLAVPLAALIGIPLYLTNISALPIVNGLLTQGMQPGAAIAFLIAGPITTVPAMTAVWGIVNRRVFALYLSVGLLGAMVLGFLVNGLIW